MLADNIHERAYSAPPDSAWSQPDKNTGKEHSARWNVANPVLSSGRVSKVKSCRERTFSGGYSRGRTSHLYIEKFTNGNLKFIISTRRKNYKNCFTRLDKYSKINFENLLKVPKYPKFIRS